MPDDGYDLPTSSDEEIDSSTRLLSNPPHQHTQLQPVALRCGIYRLCPQHTSRTAPRRTVESEWSFMPPHRLHPRSLAEAFDRMSTNRPRCQPEIDRRVHTCGRPLLERLL